MNIHTASRQKAGFTIVELLVVIVIIAILATIVTVAYNGITRRATETSLQSDLTNTATKLAIHKADNGDTYPTSLNGSIEVKSSGTALTYYSDGSTYCLSASSTTIAGARFFITQDGVIKPGNCAPAIIAFATGARHVLAIGSNGLLYGWGTNNSREVGNNQAANQTTPATVSNYGSLVGKKVTAVAAQYGASFAVTDDGMVHAWGYNNVGQLGVGGGGTVAVPTAVTGGSLAGKTIIQIATGSLHTLALASDGTVHAWGYNGWGQLGNNATTTQTTPINVSGYGSIAGKTITKVFAGDNSSYAIASDGTVHAWGMNTRGQLGDGTMVNNRNAPVAITNSGSIAGKTIATLSIGAEHALALASDGTLHAWGNNTYGQLGNNTLTQYRAPFQ